LFLALSPLRPRIPGLVPCWDSRFIVFFFRIFRCLSQDEALTLGAFEAHVTFSRSPPGDPSRTRARTFLLVLTSPSRGGILHSALYNARPISVISPLDPSYGFLNHFLTPPAPPASSPTHAPSVGRRGVVPFFALFLISCFFVSFASQVAPLASPPPQLDVFPWSLLLLGHHSHFSVPLTTAYLPGSLPGPPRSRLTLV